MTAKTDRSRSVKKNSVSGKIKQRATVEMGMNTIKHRFLSGQRLSGIQSGIATLAILAALLPPSAEAERVYRSKLSDKVIVESGTASQVSEKVRAGAPGVLVEVFVRVGETVKKGQVLGHTELAATKYQLDLAREALANEATLQAAKGHADAWVATRMETEDALRKRKVEKTRLDWATGMEQFYRGSYEAQLEQKKVQRIQYEYWKDQYEARYFRAPVDGIVTEVMLEVGKPVTYATHVFTISNEKSYMVPVTVPEEYAAAAVPNSTLPVRVTNGRHVARGLVDRVAEDPKNPGKKIITLMVNQNDFPRSTGQNLSGAKFDVLLPQGETPVQDSGVTSPADGKATKP